MTRVGIALGGGGIAGCAHLGVLMALEEAGITFHCITGTSSGGLVAALYASGYTTDQIIQMVPELTKKYMDYDYRSFISKLLWSRQKHQSIIKGKKFRDFLGVKIKEKNMKDLILPVALIATDLKTAKKVIFTSKPLVMNSDEHEELSDVSIIDAVLASCAIPAIFPPIELGERILVDGGIIDNCPSVYARALGADKIIAVDLCTFTKVGSPMNSLLSIFNRSLNVFLVHQAKSLHNHTDVLLSPDVSDVGSLAFDKTSSCIELGYQYTKNRMGEIEAALELTPDTNFEPVII